MKINFNYRKAVADAGKLDEFARELEYLANNRIETVIENLGAAWKGESSTMMLGKCRSEKEKVLEHAAKLRDAASKLRSAANQIRKAEEEAIELLKEKNMNK